MALTPEKIAASNRETLDAFLSLASIGFAGVERLTALNLNTARGALDLVIESEKTLSGVKTPDEFAAALASVTRPAIDNGVSYMRTVYSISSEVVGQIGAVVDARLNAVKLDFSAVLDEALKSAPAGSEPAVAVIRSAVAATNSAYDALTKAAKQAGEIAESNLALATDNAVKALGSVTVLPTKGKKKVA